MLEKASKSKIPEKIIVYFATAKQTSLMASYMSKIGIDVMEIHSRLSQVIL
jgi:superfamily II DNA/RNA helicase